MRDGPETDGSRFPADDAGRYTEIPAHEARHWWIESTPIPNNTCL